MYSTPSPLVMGQAAFPATSSKGLCLVDLSCAIPIFDGLCSGSCFPGLNPSLVFKGGYSVYVYVIYG